MASLEQELSTILETTRKFDPFGSTSWTLVTDAQAGSAEALNELIETYREPVVKHFCRHLGGADGEDAAQDYLCGLLGSGYLGQAESVRGKFRAFLLHDMRFFILAWRRFHSAQKRGGGREKLSYESAIKDGMQFEDERDGWEEVAFDRDWTLGLMERASQELRRIYEARGQAKRFEVLGQFINFGGDAEGYARAGSELGLDASTVKVAVSRLRNAYAQILRDMVARSLGEGESIDDELAYLKDCFLRAQRQEEGSA